MEPLHVRADQTGPVRAGPHLPAADLRDQGEGPLHLLRTEPSPEREAENQLHAAGRVLAALGGDQAAHAGPQGGRDQHRRKGLDGASEECPARGLGRLRVHPEHGAVSPGVVHRLRD